MMTLRFRHRLIAGAITLVLLAAVPAGAGAAPASQASVPAVVEVPAGTTAPAPGSKAPAPQAQLTQEEALAKVKAVFKVPEETPSLTIRAYLNQHGDRAVWSFQVDIQMANMGYGYGLAEVDAVTGRILQYTATIPEYVKIPTGPLPPAKPEEEARAAAWQLVQKLYPDVAPTLKPSNETMGYTYYSYPEQLANDYRFGWQEYRNGVPVPSSQVMVAVDKATLAPTQVSYSLLEGLTYPEAKPVVTEAQALQTLREQVEPRLFYLPKGEMNPYGPEQVRQFQLVYQFDSAYRQVDALTGKFYDGVDVPKPAGKPVQVPEGRVTPVATAAGPLTEAEATRIAGLILQVPSDAGLMVEREMFGEAGLSVRLNPMGPDQPYGQATFDEQTGMIRMANRNIMRGPNSPAQPPKPAEITPAQEAKALEAAMAVVQQYYSQVRSQLRYVPAAPPIYQSPSLSQTRYYRFQRYVNGVPAGNDGVSVAIDIQTLTWRSFNSNWSTRAEFPAIEGLITPDKALETFFANRKMELVYWPVRKLAPAPSRMGPFLPVTEAALVYRLTGVGPGILDARTGAAVAYDGESLDSLETAAKKVAGHAAEGELRFMLSRRILRPMELNPYAAITRGKALQMLLVANDMGMGSSGREQLPYSDVKPSDAGYALVVQAYRSGWLHVEGDARELRTNDLATRAQFAVWAVRLLGYGNLARSTIAIKSGYTDLSGLTAEERNAAGILEALGLIPQAEKFRGHEAITQAEAAALTVRIYNTLRNR
ncbi:MAG TPA: YcdB/YcdC domain-containing protein [Symbiobacteriaceae bacterium]|nr:YcdB/YcdC domain-containing protein [Symbiobacteriaceae bacterium]